MSNEITDFFDVPIKINSYVATSYRTSNNIRIYKVHAIGFGAGKYDTILSLGHRSPRIHVYKQPHSVIVIPDQQMTFHILRTGEPFSKVLANTGAAKTDFFGTVLKDDSFVALAVSNIEGFTVHKINKINGRFELDPDKFKHGLLNSNKIIAMSDEQIEYNFIKNVD